MIYRIIGRGGSGKTAYLLEAAKKAHEAGNECIFLTPEQQSVSTEKALCTLLGGSYNLNLEVLNFERLPDFVFRAQGGVALSRADSKTLSLFAAIACENAKDKLLTYESSALDKEFTKKISSTIERLQNSGITPKALLTAAGTLEEGKTNFKNKLYDIAEIYYQYSLLLEKGYADSAGIQKQLLESLKEKNFFEGKTVFIDGYYNFTKAEEPIVEMIFKGAKDTYISVLYDEKDQSGIFDVNLETLKLIDRMGKGVTTIFASSPRKRTQSLNQLEKNLFSISSKDFQDDGSVSIIPSVSPFEECENVAQEIINLVKNGYRYRDISIATRDDASFEGILDTALDKYGIPFYSSEKDELSTKELSSVILSLLEISYTDWSTSSVLKYVNSTFSPLEQNEADLLSIYAESWRIRGRRWYEDESWLMNPSGYKTDFSKREQEMLSIVNKGREKLLFALESHVGDLKSKHLTIAKGVRIIYDHLIHIQADKVLEKQAEELLAKGLSDEAAKISALWDSIMSILTTLFETSGDMKVSPKRLYDLIRLMMDEYKIGSIPTSSDSVEIGNASVMRPKDCKVIFVLGLNDGVFPASPSMSGLFSNAEREYLKSVGIDSETLPDEFMKNEFLLFYNLCAAPSHKLFLSYSLRKTSGDKARPSVFVDSITDIFGENCKKTVISSKKSKIVKSDEVKNTFSEKLSLSPVEPETLPLSSTKIETYLKCPFAYYCKYVLGLKSFDKAELSANDKGTYFHKIIELFTKSLFETGKFVSKTPDEIETFFKENCDKYKYDVFHGNNNEREKYAFDKHEEIIIPLLQNINDEFASGGFIPVEFEGNTFEKYSITNKTTASLEGKADRIDILEKDGEKYVRIVDYKTGEKKLTEADVKNGYEMQMLTYLFSKCQNGEIPAGVLYFLCGLPSSKSEKFERKGIMLKNDAVKEAMTFLTENKHFSEKSFKNSDVFDTLKENVSENVKRVGKSIIDGIMDACPDESQKPCKYCNARLYCRKMTEEE